MSNHVLNIDPSLRVVQMNWSLNYEAVLLELGPKDKYKAQIQHNSTAASF